MIYSCLGISHNKGTSKNTGKPYDFYSMTIMAPVPAGREGFGYYTYQKFINADMYNHIAANGEKYPIRVDITANLNGYIESLKVVK